MKLSAELQIALNKLRNEADALNKKEGVTIEEVQNKSNEIKLAKAKLDLQLQNEADEEAERNAAVKVTVGGENPIGTLSIGEIIAKAVIGTATVEELGQIKNLMQEDVKEKGGIIVPADIKTQIIELQRKQFDIRPFIDVEPTSVLKGSRVKEAGEPDAVGFASVDEAAEFQLLHEPTFVDVEYAVRKYGGIIPITAELLEDTPENILAYILKWMAKNELNTYGYQVFNGSGVKAAEGIMTDVKKVNGKLLTRILKLDTAPTIKQFKTVFNKDLEAIDNDSKYVYTNADGYDYLDGLEDKNGHPYLQPDVTRESGYKFLNKTIVQVPSKFLATYDDAGTNRTPFICGDLKLLYTMYDRAQMTIESTKVGGDTWKTDKTEIKGRFRFDGKINGDIMAVKILLAKLD
ncbi:phage major capsid protein [Clostridium sp. CF012]|uniref:phage major capsid protein n=1 Tax=Clostridium sp. CF012 TaxID=2843319 RepID=UPI001C0CF855|nr:phage major capsid protein [Clostridium sp. CF012]MBU3146629.1 phage major capsid protein [Clostridium sp. CF012]